MSQGYCDISRARSWTCLDGHLFTRCVGITSNDCARLAVGADKIVPVTCFILLCMCSAQFGLMYSCSMSDFIYQLLEQLCVYANNCAMNY